LKAGHHDFSRFNDNVQTQQIVKNKCLQNHEKENLSPLHYIVLHKP